MLGVPNHWKSINYSSTSLWEWNENIYILLFEIRIQNHSESFKSSITLNLLKLMPALNWSAYSIYINAKPLYNNPKSENNILYDFLVCTFPTSFSPPHPTPTHRREWSVLKMCQCARSEALWLQICLARPFGQGRISENVMHMNRLDGMAKGLLLAV